MNQMTYYMYIQNLEQPVAGFLVSSIKKKSFYFKILIMNLFILQTYV